MVALGAEDMAFGEAEHPPAGQAVEPGGDLPTDLVVQGRVAHHAALADARLADLELRLDQGDQTCALSGRRERRRVVLKVNVRPRLRALR